MEKLGHGEEKGQKFKMKLFEDFSVIFLGEKNHLYICLKIFRLDKSNKIVQPVVTIIDVPRDDTA